MLLTPPLLSPPAMVELDGDDIRISSRGKVAERDIVQVTSPPHTTRGVWGHPPPPPTAWPGGASQAPQISPVTPGVH